MASYTKFRWGSFSCDSQNELFLQCAGSDGLALTSENGDVVCQTGMGLVWVHAALGRPVAMVRSPRGLGTTNCAFAGPGSRTLFITVSDTGSILKAEFDPSLGIAFLWRVVAAGLISAAFRVVQRQGMKWAVGDPLL